MRPYSLCVELSDRELKEIAERIVAAAASPARVFVFGSRARGEHRPESDLDLLVIQAAVQDRLVETMRLRDAVGAVDVPVDLLVVSEETAARRVQESMSLVARALGEGRLLAA